MRELEQRDPIDIWLAYSDLFSGVFVLVFGLLLFQLFPMGDGNGDGEDQELLKRKAAQWELTSNLFQEVKKSGFTAAPDDLKKVEERFNDKTRRFDNIVVFKDSEGKDAVIIYKPDGEEQRISFGSQLLFENTGPHLKRLKNEGIKLLRSIGPSILMAGSRNCEIRVIGHTDVKQPQNSNSPDYNWVLSSERAIAVVTMLLTDKDIGDKLSAENRDFYEQYERDKIGINITPNRISAIGKGEFEPLGSVIGEGWIERGEKIRQSWGDEPLMSKNRRIELVVKFVPSP